MQYRIYRDIASYWRWRLIAVTIELLPTRAKLLEQGGLHVCDPLVEGSAQVAIYEVWFMCARSVAFG